MILNLFTTSERVSAISLAVSITVIVLLFITLAVSFFLYYRYYRRCIDNQLEDNYIRNEIKGENRKFFKGFDALLVDQTMTRNQKIDKYNEETLEDYVDNLAVQKNGLKVLANCVLGLVYIVFLALMVFVGYVRASGEQFAIGDTYYVIILTGSMEEARESNTYLASNKLTNQISTFSLIGLEKIESEDDIKLYDIVSYYNSDKELIVHRVISIGVNDDGETTYTLRGDANAFSDTEERNLTIDKLDAKFNGYQNFGLGLFINYIRSNIGIITVSLALILIMVYDFFDIMLGKRINLRKEYLYPIIDEENIQLLGTYEYLYIDPNYSPEYDPMYDPRDGFGSNEELKALLEYLRKKPQFLKNIDPYDRNLMMEYEELKDYCLSYGMRGVFDEERLDFHINGLRFVSISVHDDSLLLHFKLKSYYYTDSPIQQMLFDDTENEDIDYSDVVMGFYVRDNTTLAWAKVLIDDMMIRNKQSRKTPFISYYPTDK